MLIQNDVKARVVAAIFMLVAVGCWIYCIVAQVAEMAVVNLIITLMAVYMGLQIGKTIELSENGCVIRYGFLKFSYTWQEMAYRAEMSKQDFYPQKQNVKRMSGTAQIYDKFFMFAAAKGDAQALREKIEKNPSGYMSAHLCSSFVFQFKPEKKRQMGDIGYYEVDEQEFRQFVNRIQLAIENFKQ